jgi:hypothetical protein
MDILKKVKSTIVDRNASKKFVFCALCGIKRQFLGHRSLTKKMWFEVLSIGSLLSVLLFPLLEFKGLISLGLVAMIYDFANMSVYRKEVRCPHCGFDPIWYRKNWRLAKTMIQTTIADKKK